MKLAAQMFTVREFTASEKEVAETVRRIRKIGYDAVQISGLKHYEPKSLKKILDENGMTVCATHTPFDRILNDTEAVIDEHRLFGTKYVGIGWYERQKSFEECDRTLKNFAAAADKLAAAGMKLLYHNHEHEFIKIDGVRTLDYIRDNTDPDKFGFIADLYWVQFAGESPLRFIKEYAGRIPVVHFKDMRAVERDSKLTRISEIGNGNMDYVAVCDACKSAGVEWAAIEQDFCDGDPFDSLKESYEYVKNHLTL